MHVRTRKYILVCVCVCVCIYIYIYIYTFCVCITYFINYSMVKQILMLLRDELLACGHKRNDWLSQFVYNLAAQFVTL
jgi:hypothetical protein